nr:cytochrome P450 [Actinokineospora inagensis]
MYAEVRRGGPARPVLLSQGLRAWLVTDYADVKALLADPRLSKDFSGVEHLLDRHREPGRKRAEFGVELSAHMLNSDPPDHSRLRKLVNKAFTVRGVGHLRPRIEKITADLLDALDGQDEADLVPSFAFPLPMTVICELLGVPNDDRDSFHEWTTVLTSSGAEPEEITAVGVAAAGYVGGLIAAKRVEPGNDLLTALIEASEDGDRLSEHELISMVFLLMLAGHETTVNLIGNAVLTLLRHPDQLAALRADPTLIPAAVEELLRYESPVATGTLRYTTVPIQIGAVEIPAQEFVLVGLGCANRDPAAFPTPDRFDIHRDLNSHLAFGHGIHYCVGAPLARLEGEIALAALLTRFPGIALATDNLRWRESTLIRGLTSLPVRLR